MKTLLIFILTLSSLTGFSQDTISCVIPKPKEKQYVQIIKPIPFKSKAVTLVNPGPTVEANEVTSKLWLIPSVYNRQLIPNGIKGTRQAPYIIKSQSDYVRSWVGGSSITSGQQIFDGLNGSTYV